MKAARLTGRERIEICDVSPPEIKKETDVLVRVGVVGICGSDVHYYKNGKIGEQVISFPFTIGHEMAGVVEDVGKHVKRVKPGDKVAIDPAISCNNCDQCAAHRPHTCRNLQFLSCPGQLEGCLTEFIVMPEHNCYLLPEQMSLETATLCEPLAIGYYAVKLTGHVMDKTIGILGAGPIGLSVMLACMHKGAERIYVTDMLDYRCKAALDHGAVWTGNPDKSDIVGEITEKEPHQLDVVFECCGKQEAFDQAFLLLKPGGSLILIGIPAFTHYRFSADIGRRNELCIRHVRRQNDCTGDVIDLAGSGLIKPDFMETHRFSLNEVSGAFKVVSGYEDNVIKAMIHVI